jgi:hypothetical protein
LNEILYPYANRAKGREIIQQYEPNKSNAQKGSEKIFQIEKQKNVEKRNVENFIMLN